MFLLLRDVNITYCSTDFYSLSYVQNKNKKTTRNKQNKLKNIHENKSAKSITNGIIWLWQKNI